MLLGFAWLAAASWAWAAEPAGGKVPESALVLLPVAGDPTVSFRIWFQVGSQDDPPGKEGLAALTASMLAEGSTRQHSYQQIVDLLYPMAADYSASTSVEMTVISGRVHRDNLAGFYRLLSEAILSPGFRQEDLDRLKSDTLNFLSNSLRYSSDEELSKAVLYQEIFAGTPYGHLPAGVIQSVQSITMDDMRAFYRAHYTRDNVVIGLGGGYDQATVDRLRGDLAKLPAGKPAAVPPPSPRPIHGLHVTIVQKPATATAISLGYPIDLLRGQPDWYPLAVANSWLGEHRNPASHLYQVIRDKRGLNYGDYSYIEHFPAGGSLLIPPQNVGRRRQIFEIWIRPVPNEARQFALRAAVRELALLAERGLTPEEFSLTKSFLGKNVLHYAATTMERLGYAMDDRFYHVPGSHIELFHRRMGDVTPAQTNAAVKRYLQADNLQIVIVTRDAKTLADALVHNTPSPITYPSPKPPAILAEDRLISAYPLKIRPENVKIVPVEKLFVK
jgi:zinc protease